MLPKHEFWCRPGAWPPGWREQNLVSVAAVCGRALPSRGAGWGGEVGSGRRAGVVNTGVAAVSARLGCLDPGAHDI